VLVRSAVGMDEGADKRGMDRYEELTRDGEKPLTTLVVLLTDVPLAESVDAGCADCSDALSETEVWLSTEDVVISGMVVAGVDSAILEARGARLKCGLSDRG
jgi:hypothetical protein